MPPPQESLVAAIHCLDSYVVQLENGGPSPGPSHLLNDAERAKARRAAARERMRAFRERQAADAAARGGPDGPSRLTIGNGLTEAERAEARKEAARKRKRAFRERQAADAAVIQAQREADRERKRAARKRQLELDDGVLQALREADRERKRAARKRQAEAVAQARREADRERKRAARKRQAEYSVVAHARREADRERKETVAKRQAEKNTNGSSGSKDSRWEEAHLASGFNISNQFGAPCDVCNRPCYQNSIWPPLPMYADLLVQLLPGRDTGAIHACASCRTTLRDNETADFSQTARAVSPLRAENEQSSSRCGGELVPAGSTTAVQEDASVQCNGKEDVGVKSAQPELFSSRIAKTMQCEDLTDCCGAPALVQQLLPEKGPAPCLLDG
ncbi:uncharacterized protein [Dermacentor andersoni]|uniref:uncharacterized protein n=1 Tax=Dermacentor andersoni TaxID=34620 RepID=UPI002155C36B|nr:translation initiation factor IF-2-like [Dermacentor andersoni]